MTAQMPDEFRFEGEKYSLIGIRGSKLYKAEDFGLEPREASTACYRGYIMYYDCVNGRMILDRMHVNSKEAGPINGVDPVPNEHEIFSPEFKAKLPESIQQWSLFKYTYNNLNLKTKFSGSLLLGKDFIQSMYVHMGYQRPMAFRIVLELQIEDGDIIAINDLSSKMEELRITNSGRGARPDTQDKDEILEWIDQAFSLDYGFD
ncbi:MAG: hypothetical protein ACXAEF_06055 [Candidatus Thorarchaeota archaeon]